MGAPSQQGAVMSSPSVAFQVHALPAESFAPLFAKPDAELQALRVRRVVADGRPVYPCRVSLQDASEGERLLLLPFEHHPVETPYRASGPVYVRESALQARPGTGEVPELLRRRLLSLRAYDGAGMMRGAEVVQGTGIEAAIERLFGMAPVDYIHVHYALPGCYACRIECG
jgi:hypothetical protein